MKPVKLPFIFAKTTTADQWQWYEYFTIKVSFVLYLELLRLDFDVVRAIRLRNGQLVTTVDVLKRLFLTQFHGLEIKPVSALNAQTALWLTEQQCSRLVKLKFGEVILTIHLNIPLIFKNL